MSAEHHRKMKCPDCGVVFDVRLLPGQNDRWITACTFCGDCVAGTQTQLVPYTGPREPDFSTLKMTEPERQESLRRAVKEGQISLEDARRHGLREAGERLAHAIAEQAVGEESGPDAKDGGERLRAAFISDANLQRVIAQAVTLDPAQALAVIQGRQDHFDWGTPEAVEEGPTRLTSEDSEKLKRKIVAYLHKHPGVGRSTILLGTGVPDLSKNVFSRLMRELLDEKEVCARGQRGKRRYWVKA